MITRSMKNSSDTVFEANNQSRRTPSFLATAIIVAGALMIPATTGLAQPIIKPGEGNAKLQQRLPSPLNDQSVSARLTAAARTFGVEIQSEHTAYASGNGISVVAAPIAGLEDIRPSELTEGPTTMFAYVKAPGHEQLPEAGYYQVKTTVEKAEKGASATMTFINVRNGEGVKFEAVLQEVSSEEDPEVDQSRNFVDVSKQGSVAAQEDISIRVWVESGMWRACVEIEVEL